MGEEATKKRGAVVVEKQLTKTACLEREQGPAEEGVGGK